MYKENEIRNKKFLVYLFVVGGLFPAGATRWRTIYVHNRNNPIIKGSTFCSRRFEEEHDVAADESLIA